MASRSEQGFFDSFKDEFDVCRVILVLFFRIHSVELELIAIATRFRLTKFTKIFAKLEKCKLCECNA